MVEDAIRCAFDAHAVRLQESEQGRHGLHIGGLGTEQEERVRTVLSAVHIFHTDGDMDRDECPDACLALDWHTDPESGSPPNTLTEIGQSRNRAKWGPNLDAAIDMAKRMQTVVQAHSAMSEACYIAAPPSTAGFAAWLAHTLGYCMNIPVISSKNIGEFSSQRDASAEGVDFDELCKRRQGTILVWTLELSGSVLIIDDLYYSGGTIRELTRQCRALGAERILALTVTKSLKHHRQT